MKMRLVNKKSVVPALVMNCHYNGLSLIQALGRHGISAVAVDSTRGIGTRSRYADYLKVPDPGKDRKAFIKTLVEFGANFEEKPIIFPTNDHWAEALAWGAEELSQHYRLCVADLKIIELLLDKERFGRWAMDNDIKVPSVWSASEALEKRKKISFPVAVKANTRRRSGQAADSATQARNADRFRFVPCSDEKELTDKLEEAKSNGVPVFCQQVVNGRSDAMRTIGIYANNGNVLGLVYGRKVKGFPAQYGDCIVGQAEPAPDWARDLAIKCCGLLGYTGIAELEVMIDKNTGDRHLIEINPRSWSWVGIGPTAGVDLAWIAYQDMVYDIQPEKWIEGCADGQSVYYAKILADFQNTVFWYRFSSAPEWAQSPIVWKKAFKGKGGVYAEFSRDDLVVSFFSLLASGRQFAANAYKVIRGYRFD
ncbi:MAG: ATP-grasp domain-containing protein [Pseudomonadota bacterium]